MASQTGGVALLVLALVLMLACPSHERDPYHPPPGGIRSRATGDAADAEATPAYWAKKAREAIDERVCDAEPKSTAKARNVVLFLGDGMSVPTLTAARTLLGQRRGATGEEAELFFERFPTTGLSKTYCVDAQVADSACSATAYLCGAKANIGTIGVSAAVAHSDCDAAAQRRHHVRSIAEWALATGRAAGLVTTTRVTHASPAGAYAHVASRDWESDADVRATCPAEPRPRDIALQLVHDHPGRQFQVILGGGRREFLPETVVDEEGSPGKRLDGRNLIEEWQEDKRAREVSYRYVWNREQLMNASTELPEYLLGLFESSHMQFHLQADPRTEPTLADLTEVAIRSLSRNDKGFFLFVEGGRIDHAHHENLAQLALDETLELSEAVARAAAMLPASDSLLVVTADHAHVMSISGYTARGSDIAGPSDGVASDGVPYMTLSYANGPGHRVQRDGVREDITQQDYRDPLFPFEALVPLSSETHGGDDVAVFARGPHHALFSGLYEQSHLPHFMAYAACLGPAPHACSDASHAP